MSTEIENFKIPDRWSIENNQLSRKFDFSSYSGCVDFTNLIADLAENKNHHPSITLEYAKVIVRLYSHDKGSITQRDIDFAQAINDLTL